MCALKHIRRTREHWIQRITFAAETNATRVQSRLGGHTDTHTTRRGDGNNGQFSLLHRTKQKLMHEN